MDAVRELAELLERLLELAARSRRASSVPRRGRRGRASSWRPIPSASSRCWAPSWRSRSSRRRSLVAGLDDPRARLAQLDQLGAQLRLEALVLERQPGRRADRLQQPRLVEQITVVDQHCESLTEIRDPARARRSATRSRDPARPPRHHARAATTQDKRRVAQRARERITHLTRLDLTELHDQIRHRERAAASQTERRAAAESPKKPYQEK